MTFQFLAGAEGQVTGQTFVTLPVKHAQHTQAAGYQHLVHLGRHTRCQELGAVFNLVLMIQPTQQISHGDLTQFADEIRSLAVYHELWKVYIERVRSPGYLWTRTSLYHSSGGTR